MANKQFQLGLLKNEADDVKLSDASMDYCPDFIECEYGWELFEHFVERINWQQDTVVVYGKRHLTPRLSYWVGDDWMDYSYSSNTMQPAPWSQELLDIKHKIEEATGDTFNSVLLNYYRDGQDSNGWHSDNEPELGIEPVIASLSLGGARDFQLRHKYQKELKHTLRLEHGSLLVMRGRSQSHWQHQVPKRAKASGRVNLTFRTIIHPEDRMIK